MCDDFRNGLSCTAAAGRQGNDEAHGVRESIPARGGDSRSQAARSGIDAEPRLADKNGGLGIVLPPEAPVLIPVGVPLSSFQLFKQFQSQCATVLDDAAHLFDTLHMHLQLLRHDVEAHEAAIKRVMNWLATDC